MVRWASVRRARHRPPLLEPTPISTSDDGLKGIRVLVVEDTYFIADDIAVALRRAGASVVGPAPTRGIALSLLASERVDAAVLDINLKGDAAYAVADLLVAEGKPFVFATGYGRSTIPAAYATIGLWEKPFDTAALVRSLRALLPKTT